MLWLLNHSLLLFDAWKMLSPINQLLQKNFIDICFSRLELFFFNYRERFFRILLA